MNQKRPNRRPNDTRVIQQGTDGARGKTGQVAKSERNTTDDSESCRREARITSEVKRGQDGIARLLLTADPILRRSTLHVLHQTGIQTETRHETAMGKVLKTMTKWVGGVTGVDDGSKKRANASHSSANY